MKKSREKKFYQSRVELEWQGIEEIDDSNVAGKTLVFVRIF